MYKIAILLVVFASNTFAKDFFIRPDSTHAYIRDGSTFKTAWSIDEIEWTQMKAGDYIYLCGTFNNKLTLGGNKPKWGGDKGKNIIVSGACKESSGSIQNINGNAIEIVRRDYVTIQNLLINNITGNGITAYGRGGRYTPEANRNLTIKDIRIENVGGSGIVISCLNGYQNYAPQTGILLEDVTILNAARHGIYASCYQDGTIIRRAKVNGTATKGNYWGIDVSSRFHKYSGNDWKLVSGSVYKLDISEVSPHWNGSPGWETILELIHTNTNPYYLTKERSCIDYKSCIKNLDSFEFGQVGKIIYINIGITPNNQSIAFISAPFGSIIVEDSYVTGTSNNNGKTDGVGIGADLGTKHVTFRRNISELNQGSGFELAGASNFSVYDNIAKQNGKWGFFIHKTRGDSVILSRNHAINNGVWQFHFRDNMASKIQFDDNLSKGAAECFHIAHTKMDAFKNNSCIITKRTGELINTIQF